MAMVQNITIDWLRSFEALKDKSDEQLNELLALLKANWITTTVDLANVTRSSLDGKIPALALDALKPEQHPTDASSENIVSSQWKLLVPMLMKIVPPRIDNKVDEDNEMESDERMASAAAETKQEAVQLMNFAPPSTNNRADDGNEAKFDDTLAPASAEMKEEKEYNTKQEGGSQQESGCSDDEEEERTEVESSVVKSDIVDEKESSGTKREKDDDKNDDNRDSKKIKLWVAHKKPVAVSTEAEWYLGHKGEELFIRQSTEDCFNIMWQAVEASKNEWKQKERDGYVAFVVTGAPGLGKSWCSNAMVWYLLRKRQSMWFHSAGNKTLTKIEFHDNAPPVVTDLPEDHVLTLHPHPGTWFLYDSVGNIRSGQRLIEFSKQPPGVPCIIFSSPKDTNYVSGLTMMQGSSIGGKVWYLWMPTWAWVELEAVMNSLYKSFAGSQSQRTIDEFKEFVKAMYDIWGGIPRRFALGYSTFEDRGKDAAIEEAENQFKKEMASLAPQVINRGPIILPKMLDATQQTGESDSPSHTVSPPSWLMHPLPIESTGGTFRNCAYRFCSRKAEVLFLDHLAKAEVGVIRQFCRQVFTIPAGYGLAFERFAHFVLTRTEVSDYSWRKYSKSERKKLTLPKCRALKKCDMKTDLAEFKKQIVRCINENKDGVIDPLSDQQDAIDMFIVFKDGQVFAMQDTISKTHSFHPVKILEYRKAAKDALESANVGDLSDDFFKHVIVVPTQDESSKFQLQWPTMPGLDGNLEAAIAKFDELGLKVPANLQKRTNKDSLDACRQAKVTVPSNITASKAKIKGAEADLLMQAKMEVERRTWVLDGFF